ncbi:MAG: hypothetical protein RSC18_05280, partial [Raoultibacter sp.]
MSEEATVKTAKNTAAIVNSLGDVFRKLEGAVRVHQAATQKVSRVIGYANGEISAKQESFILKYACNYELNDARIMLEVVEELLFDALEIAEDATKTAKHSV